MNTVNQGPLIVGIESTTLSPQDITRLQSPAVGGVLLFARNFDHREQLIELTHAIHKVRSPPLIIAVDQEGGRVQRFKQGFTLLPAMRTLGLLYDQDPEQALHMTEFCGWLLASELLASGVDLSFAPVVDIDYGQNAMLGDRCFHADSHVVAALATQLITGLHKAGMQAVAKHFPGHGHVDTDSHLEMPIDERPLSDFEQQDLIPYKHLIANDLKAIMLAHLTVPQVDPQSIGFSKTWVQYLRQNLQFNGLIFSDDIGMKAITQYPMHDRIQNVLNAGCDLVICGNELPKLDELLSTSTFQVNPISNTTLSHFHGHNKLSWDDLLQHPYYQQNQPHLQALTDNATLQGELWQE